MCNIVEEYTAKKVAEVSARSRDEGMRIANLTNIKNIMRNKHWSAEEAMEAIGIEQSQYKQYLALL